jgi:16S rRNA (adenine1518-N6/adenine1519-N6)-dimethyltransferase
MVQRELGERWTATTGGSAYSAVSIHVDFYAEVRIVGDVPRTVFLPQPKVDSVLVGFTRRSVDPVEVAAPGALLAFIRSAFGHRRKTLRNALIAAGFERDHVERALTSCGITSQRRPQELSLSDFAQLHAAIASGAAV